MTRIVVIDAEPIVRTVLTSILERHGYSVKAVGEFPEALRVLRDKPPDLVITNVFLRGITGREAMKAIRQEFPALPVLMVSGLPDQDVIEKWEREPGFDIFPKPFASESLVQKVRQVLG